VDVSEDPSPLTTKAWGKLTVLADLIRRVVPVQMYWTVRFIE